MRILTITLLLSVYLCALAMGIPNWRLASHRFPPCCVHVSSTNSSSTIIGDIYEKPPANGGCVEAIIFRTDKGKICANPKAEWVKNIIAKMTAGNL